MEPYIGEIRMFGFGWVPLGFAFCDGTLLPVAQNQALFSLIGFAYGGNGSSTFALPDLRGRAPLDAGKRTVDGHEFDVGVPGGAETVTLTSGNLPAHTHSINVQTVVADKSNPPNNLLSIVGAQTGKPTTNLYVEATSSTQSTPTTPLHPSTLSMVGTGAPHGNLQPYQVTNFCIAISGFYPSRS